MRLSDALRGALDPSSLMLAQGMMPDSWQHAVLQSPAPRQLWCCARQTGKSATAATLAVYEATFKPESLVLLLSPSLRQSSELFRKVLDLYRALGRPVPVVHESALRIELANGSRIVSLPESEDRVRGFSGVALLAVDEAARVSDPLYYAVRPMLATSGGRLVCLSTPFGKRGFFFTEWTEGQGWDRVRITAEDCPRIAPAFLAEERAHLGDRWYRQEYLCEFVQQVGQVFSPDLVAAAVTADVRPLFPVA